MSRPIKDSSYHKQKRKSQLQLQIKASKIFNSTTTKSSKLLIMGVQKPNYFPPSNHRQAPPPYHSSLLHCCLLTTIALSITFATPPSFVYLTTITLITPRLWPLPPRLTLCPKHIKKQDQSQWSSGFPKPLSLSFARWLPYRDYSSIFASVLLLDEKE